MDMNERLDYSNLSAVELKAIAISHQNMRKNKGETFDSSFPYLTSAIEVLAEQLIDYPAVNVDELKILHDELLVVNKHLLQLAPIPPSLNPNKIVSELTNDRIIDGLLKIGLVTSLVETLTYFQKVVADRINDIENGVLKGVNNGSIN
nr:MAG TPA: hypothetical protein [Caudoviricetes sp.]